MRLCTCKPARTCLIFHGFALKNVVLLIVTLFLSLGAAEAALRITGHGPARFEPTPGERWSEPDALYGWRNRSGTYRSNEAGQIPMTFWTNHQRASRSSPSVPAGVPRVDIVGDSITQGYGVADEETYVWRLGAMLPDVAFENLGVGGYGTYQSLLVEQARSADPPRLTVYGFFGDHQFRNVAFLTWVRALRDAEGHNIVPPHVLPRGDGLARMPGRSIGPWPLETRSAVVTELHRAWMRFEFRGRREATRPATERLLAEMADTAAKAGQKFLVLLLADAPGWLIPALEARAIAYADCREPEFERDPALRIGGVGHPTAARHAQWAACLAPRIGALLAQ